MSFEYRTTGRMRFIGVETKAPQDAWDTDEVEQRLFHRLEPLKPQLDQLKTEYGCSIPYLCTLCHSRHHELGADNRFMLGYFYKEGTSVPENADYFDVISEQIGYGVYHPTDFHTNQEKGYVQTRDTILGDGNLVPYPVGYWDAVALIDGMPHDGDFEFGSVLPALVHRTYESFLKEVGAEITVEQLK